MRSLKKFIQISIPFALTFIYGINPPQSGQFPAGFWDQMEEQNIGVVYGDSGWVKKIAEWRDNSYRDAQLEFNLPVLLGKYSGATTYFTAQDFQNILFDNNSAGSMSEYYEEISHGNFTVDGTAGGWYQSTYSMSEAKANTKQYVAEIAALADPDFDYAQYDNDGPDNIPNSGDDDGYVDGIAIVYSGCGAEWGPGNDNLWPHMSSLGSSYEYTTQDASANGGYIIVSSYFVSPELAGGGDCYTDIIRPMGVYAHEFGHILGLPDLYDRDDSNGDSEGIGNWCLMAGGSWNGWGGDTPAHMSAWCKQEMGWIEPTVLGEDQNSVDIPAAATNAHALKIWEDDYYWNRYFLVENRQLTGFDAELPGSGLLVYHIDENRRWGTNRWSSGAVNDDHTHKLVDVETADGNSDMDNGINRGDGGDPFPGTSNNTDFSSNSDPNSDRYTGEATSIAVTNISSSSSSMTADIAIQPQKGIPIVYDQTGISGWGWGYSSEADHYGGVLFEYPITEEENGYLTEVDIGFRNGNNNYTLYVYDSYENSALGTLLFEVAGTASSSGWHSVPVDSVLIQPGQEFFIAYKIVGQSYAISFDKLTTPVNRSYFSGDGVSYSGSIGDSYNINLRAKLRNRTPQNEVLGCTDPYANNYDPDATSDDGSCYGYPDNGDYSISFDGVDDYTRAAWSDNMNTYTVSLWVRSNVESQELYRGFFNSYDNQSYGFQLDCNGSNQYRFYSELGTVVFAPLSTEWSHIAVVANNSTTSFYFNGDLIATENWVMDEWNHIELGRNRSTQQPGNYTVDQVSIWNTARTQTEIQGDMYNELGGNEDGLLVYWKGDAGEGEILYDHTGNANHATIYGATFIENNPGWATIDVDPDSLYQHVLIGDSTTQTITIHNTGDTDLQWEIATSNSQRIASDNNIYLTTADQGPNISSEDGPGVQDPVYELNLERLGSRPSGRDGDLQVLLMSNNTSNNDYFAGQIEPYVENMDFASWDIDQTPELTYLQQFDVILLQENGLTGNSANTGDILAEYVLDGGNLILSTFYWQDRTDGGFGTQGWGDLELYDPLYGDACDYAYQNLGMVLDHPMTEGIDELNCYYRGGPTILRDDATAVAWWSDGDPLIAYNQPGGVITAITIFPAHGAYSSFSGDFYELFSNAIYWTANASPGWLSTDLVSGTVAPGASQDIIVSLNASELDTGYYTAQLVLNSNDPIDSSVLIPVGLEVYMLFPDIAIAPDSLSEELYIGDSSVQTLMIYNNGEADLDWNATTLFLELPTRSLPYESVSYSDNQKIDNELHSIQNRIGGEEMVVLPDTRTDWLNLSVQSGTILVGESELIDVIFDASAIDEGDFSAVIQVISNDEDESQIDIPVTLIANTPYPDISVTPGSLDDNLFLGDSSLQSLIISNNGLANLNWNLNILDYGRDNNESYVFTNCGSEGTFGPSQEDCDGEYEGTSLAGAVVVTEGIQEWTVPQTGLYTIEALGAKGGDASSGGGYAGGLGAKMVGVFDLTEGEIINILVGQIGGSEQEGAGGGGSFVTDLNNNPIVVAGAGGGAGGAGNGLDAVIETFGTAGEVGGAGGEDGNGGQEDYGNGSAGGGFYTDGAGYSNGGGKGYLNGGNGGETGWPSYPGSSGGFGGGGAGWCCGGNGGGAGGYSGGGTSGSPYYGGGGGGGSFNAGENQDNQVGINAGHGLVIITLDNPFLPWVSTSENSGVIPVGASDTLDIHFNASDLESGSYLADLVIYSDDPDDSEVNIPVSLSVFDQVLLEDIPDTSLNEDSELYLTLNADYPGYDYNFSVTSDTTGVDASVENDSLLLLPTPDWTGNASIELILTLENSLSDTASFIIAVHEVNDPPNAYDHIYYIDEDDSLLTTVPADDGDSLNGAHDEQTLMYLTLSEFNHGSFDLGRTDGILSYIPDPDYFGPDSMEYVLMDDGTTAGQSDPLSDTALIVINTLPVNDDPILESLSDTSMYEDSTLSIIVSATDIDSEDLSFEALSSVDEYITVEMIDTLLYLNSHFNWYGVATITVLVNDNMGRAVDVEEFQLTVLPVNDPPEFEELFALVGVGSDFEIPVFANDIDMDTLSISLDDSFDYPDWITLECEPCRLIGNAPDEGNHPFPLLVHDGSTTLTDTFHLESRYFQPRITAIDDVPEDEGGRVYLEFQRSFFDHADQNNQFYTIFRLDQNEDSTLWVSTVTGTAGGDESYVFEVSTVVDSSGEDNGTTQFKVIAFMNAGTFESDISSGYSLDNLAPGPPTGLEAVVVDEGIHLSWDLSSADDFQYFNLDRSLSEDFEVYETFTSTDTVYLDPNYTLNEPQFYRLSAIDHSGNVSDYSDIVEAAVLAIDEEFIPDSYALYQNYPNPFNPVTTIRYDLPERAVVSIRIFDIKGRIIRTLVQETHDPGSRVVVWDATNQNGDDVSAGMYMYMIQAGKFSQVRKMLLLK